MTILKASDVSAIVDTQWNAPWFDEDALTLYVAALDAAGEELFEAEETADPLPETLTKEDVRALLGLPRGDHHSEEC